MKWPLRNCGATYLRDLTDTVQTVQYSDSQCTLYTVTILARASMLQLVACRALLYSTTTFYTVHVFTSTSTYNSPLQQPSNYHSTSRTSNALSGSSTADFGRVPHICGTSTAFDLGQALHIRIWYLHLGART